jgi:hypothetical protein
MVMPKKATPLFLVYDGGALDGLAYRIVERCPPRLEDFLSYDRLGRSYPPRKQFQATGLSMYTTFAGAESAAKRFRIGSAVAALELTRPVMWAPSSQGDHITVWAPASTMLSLVLQCEGIHNE